MDPKALDKKINELNAKLRQTLPPKVGPRLSVEIMRLGAVTNLISTFGNIQTNIQHHFLLKPQDKEVLIPKMVSVLSILSAMYGQTRSGILKNLQTKSLKDLQTKKSTKKASKK